MLHARGQQSDLCRGMSVSLCLCVYMCACVCVSVCVYFAVCNYVCVMLRKSAPYAEAMFEAAVDVTRSHCTDLRSELIWPEFSSFSTRKKIKEGIALTLTFPVPSLLDSSEFEFPFRSQF